MYNIYFINEKLAIPMESVSKRPDLARFPHPEGGVSSSPAKSSPKGTANGRRYTQIKDTDGGFTKRRKRALNNLKYIWHSKFGSDKETEKARMKREIQAADETKDPKHKKVTFAAERQVKAESKPSSKEFEDPIETENDDEEDLDLPGDPAVENHKEALRAQHTLRDSMQESSNAMKKLARVGSCVSKKVIDERIAALEQQMADEFGFTKQELAKLKAQYIAKSVETERTKHKQLAANSKENFICVFEEMHGRKPSEEELSQIEDRIFNSILGEILTSDHFQIDSLNEYVSVMEQKLHLARQKETRDEVMAGVKHFKAVAEKIPDLKLEEKASSIFENKGALVTGLIVGGLIATAIMFPDQTLSFGGSILSGVGSLVDKVTLGYGSAMKDCVTSSAPAGWLSGGYQYVKDTFATIGKAANDYNELKDGKVTWQECREFETIGGCSEPVSMQGENYFDQYGMLAGAAGIGTWMLGRGAAALRASNYASNLIKGINLLSSNSLPHTWGLHVLASLGMWKGVLNPMSLVFDPEKKLFGVAEHIAKPVSAIRIEGRNLLTKYALPVMAGIGFKAFMNDPKDPVKSNAKAKSYQFGVSVANNAVQGVFWATLASTIGAASPLATLAGLGYFGLSTGLTLLNFSQKK